jgi:hypothetical protein
MIGKQHAGNEIGRMIGLDYFPSDKKAVNELIGALCFAATEAIATTVVNDWLESQNQRPTPADLRRMVMSENQKWAEYLEQQKIAPDIVCKRCGDCGLYGGQIGTGFDGLWYWCNCETAFTRKERQPDLVDDANVARAYLLTKYGPKTLQGMIGQRAQTGPEPYNGEF